jgi:sugar phosphate isomerase/epimerase
MRCDIAAIEIYAEAPELRRRFPELRSARSRGTVISTVCLGPPFLGRLKADEIEDATRSIKDAISLAAEIDASGIVMPLAFPPFSIPTGELPRFILDAGFDGWLTLECSIDTPVEHELCNAVQLLRAAWRSDEQRLESSPG